MSVYHAFTNVYTQTLGMNWNKGHAKYCGSCILTLHFGKIHDVLSPLDHDVYNCHFQPKSNLCFNVYRQLFAGWSRAWAMCNLLELTINTISVCALFL